MSTLSAVVLTGALAVAGGVAGFNHVVDGQSTRASADMTSHVAKQPHRIRVVGKPIVRIKVRPCHKGYTRTHGTCVRHVQHTVVVNVPAPPVPAAPPTTAPPAPVVHTAPVRQSGGEDHSSTGGASEGGGGHDSGGHDGPRTGGEHEGPSPSGGGEPHDD